MDPYLEKLLEIKLSQGDEKLQSKLKEQHGCAVDSTANKSCSIKVRAIGIDQEIVTWIEQNLRGLKDCFDITQLPPGKAKMAHKLKLESVRKFITTFCDLL